MTSTTAGRRLRMGMIGGGPGAFIGNVHRMAARLDNEIELVCGAFSSDPEKSKAQGAELFLDPKRSYGSWKEMLASEAALPADQRMDFVSIVTPNHMHFPPALAALEAGFHVICDKPMTLTSPEAQQLLDKVKETNLVFGLTHNYTGYPMVKQAREMVREGMIGKVRRVVVQYPQGWLSLKLEATGQKQAAWRSDPKKSGAAGAIGDIGTHAENLATYIINQEPTQVLAELNTFVDGRTLDDDASVLIRYEDGAKCNLLCSQIASGEENDLNIKVYGEKGGLVWRQMEPNSLKYTRQDFPAKIYRTGVGDLSELAKAATRIPAGHPEGFLEAFANIYQAVAQEIRARSGEDLSQATRLDFPGVEEGLKGMNFIEAVVESSNSGNTWVEM